MSRDRTLLVLGGSQGSAALNEAFVSCVEKRPEIFAGWKIVHQTGRRDIESMRTRYAPLKVEGHLRPVFLMTALAVTTEMLD